MPVPDFQSFFKPLLDIAADGEEHSLREANFSRYHILMLCFSSILRPYTEETCLGIPLSSPRSSLKL